MLAALRQSQMAAGFGPVSAEAAARLFGLPVETTVYWDSGKGDALVGDWTQLVIGIREYISYELSTDGVLVDPGGAIQVSAFQDDMTLLRVHLRVAAAVAQPVGPAGTPVVGFEFADWTTTGTRARRRTS